MYIFRGDNFVSFFFLPSEREPYSRRKEFVPKGNKFFPFRVRPLFRTWVQESKSEVTKVTFFVKKNGNKLASISSPLKMHGGLSYFSKTVVVVVVVGGGGGGGGAGFAFLSFFVCLLLFCCCCCYCFWFCLYFVADAVVFLVFNLLICFFVVRKILFFTG